MAVVLFTDLVGSTELRGRLGEEAADELRRRHDQLLSRAVEAHNGRVVKGLGDGIMATFSGASEAVAAAVAIQQGIDRLNRSGKEAVPLAVRVGLSAGDVSFEHDDVHGTPVIEASRLCGAARGGEILASEIVRWLGGAQDALSLTPVGSLELKGLAAPVPAVRVEWQPAPGSAIPMPMLLTDIGRIFVGREAELDRLGQLWKEAAAGERRIALVAGEPGVGKTRLAAELAIRAHRDGAIVLAGRCDEDLGVPYQPFVEALRHFADHNPSAELAERLGRYGGELARLVPELQGRLPDIDPPLRSDPETERYRLFDGVTGWLTAVSGENPLLLVLDDLQWAAKPTLLLLRHVLRSPETLRVLVVGTYRDSEIGRGHPLLELLADLRRIAGFQRLPLAGLDEIAVAALLEEESGGQNLDDRGQELARRVWQETEGNPFFVVELLRHLGDSGAFSQPEARRTGAGSPEEPAIPEGIRDVVGRRLSRLSDETNRLLACAAVFGLEFEPLAVERAGPFPEQVVLNALAEASSGRLIVDVAGPVPRCRFVHALVRATLYDELTGVARAALHRKAAEAIEAIHGGDADDYLPALAHHWSRAATPSPETHKAVTYAARAGHRALAQLANDEAVAFYRQALDLLDGAGPATDGAQRVNLLISLGEAQRRAGEGSYRDTLLSAARLAQHRGDTAALAGAALANTRGHLMSVFGAVDHETVAVLEAAIAASASGTAEPAMRAKLLAILALELTFAGDWSRCLDLSDQALAMAHRLDDAETLAQVLLARFFPAHLPGLLEERLANTAELLDVAAAVADPALAARAHLLRARAALESGDTDEADRCFQIGESLSVPLGQPTLRWQVTYLQAAREIVAGRFSTAEQLLAESRQLGRLAGQADAEWIFALQAVQLRRAMGRIDADTVTLVEETAGPLRLTATVVAVGLCHLGRFDDARRALDRLGPTSVPIDPWWLFAMTNLASVAARLGARAHAAALASALRPYATQAIPYAAQPTPSVAHHLGLMATTIGRYAEAETWFASAVDAHDRLHAPHWVAGSEVEWGRMLLARDEPGDAQRARQLLVKASMTARQLRLTELEQDAFTLLQACP
jgi:class 3 adenylate cyclase/tetratricopeptide (TPR) repeat protein